MAETLDDLIGSLADLILQDELKNDGIAELRAKADRGSRAAALRLGDIYKKEKDYKEALKYYAIPAEGGNTEAMQQAGLAAIFLFAQAENKSERFVYQKKAVHFFSMATENGRVDAEFHLGMLYISSKFISQKLFARRENEKKGVEHLLRAAKKSHPEAQYYLSTAYSEGIGVRKSIDDEIFWLRCAQINGDPKANDRVRKLLNSNASHAMRSMLEKIDKKIASHKEYIDIYYISKEAREIHEESWINF